MKTIPLFLLAIVLTFTACETKRRSASTGWAYNAPSSGGFEDKSTPFFAVPGQMMIYNARLELDVKAPDSLPARLAGVAKRYQGYILEMSTSRAVIRIKADQLKSGVSEIEHLGKITHKNISGQDVTAEFRDNDIRLQNAEKARQRYLELLAKAANVDETLKVEKELERLNGEIDLLKGQQNRLGHLIEYSTITVNYREKPKPGILGYVFIGLYKGVKWLFVRN